MAATGYTPIYLYYSGTATNVPLAANLGNGELAINAADGNLFYKNTSNAVVTIPVLQSSATQSGWLSSTDWTTFNSKQPAGAYLTSVTADSPLTGAGTSASHLSMPAATSSVNGYLTSTDWSTFNGKQAALVSGTNIKTVNGSSLLGSGDVGTIDVAHGGTGLTAVTAGYIPFGSTSTALATSASGLFWDETNVRLGIFNTAPATALDVYGTIRSTRRGATSQYVDLFPTSGGVSLNVSAGSGALNISTNGGSTSMLSVDGSGNVAVSVGNATVTAGNLVIGTSGKGVDFSATPGTGTSELFADYEEGTWTPSFTNLTVVGSPTYTGSYTKIGRMVYFQIGISGATSTASTANSTYVSNLPFSANGISVCGATNGNVANYGTGYVASTYVYPPTWTTTGLSIAITGVYYV